MAFNLAKFCNWMTIYCITLSLAECSIRVTVPSEYLNLALSWVSLYNLLDRFLSTTARAFYDDYYNCRPIFSSLLNRSGQNFIKCVILTLDGFCVLRCTKYYIPTTTLIQKMLYSNVMRGHQIKPRINTSIGQHFFSF